MAAVTIAGVGIHCEGEGPQTIVMVHGWPDTHRLWDTTVTALKGRYRCVYFTLPGFDAGAPARATSLLQMTGLLCEIADAVSPGQPVILLLHDWGCAFGYEFAARHPDRVARMVAVDIGDHNSAQLARSLSAKARWQVFAYQFWLAVAWKIGGKPGDRMTRWMARALGHRADASSVGCRMNYPYAMKWCGTAGGLGQAAPVKPHCPTLYIYGLRKPFMFHSPEWLDRLAARPDCSVQSFKTGHWVMVQQPAEFSACVRRWLDLASGKPGA